VAKANGAKYLLASTSEIYGDPLVHPQKEDYPGNVDPTGERAVYDEAKRFAESLTMAYYRTHEVDTRIVRIFNTYGPRMDLEDGRALPNFLKQALLGQALTVYGDGSQTRSFCYIDDQVDGLYRLLLSDEHEPVNIGNPHEISILDFAHLINELTGNPGGIVFQDKRIEGDPQTRRPDISRAQHILKWEPRVDIREGLKQTIEYFREKC
jgi:dTDP-glucose 4,6-dehydratase